MKSNVERWAAIVFLSVFTLGCTSIRARNDDSEANEWTLYPGVQLDAKELEKLSRGEPLKSFSDDRSGPGWIKGMIATILVFDLPFSTVFDTVVAPYDLYRIYNPEDFEKAGASSDSSDQDEQGERRTLP
ncbi:MAG: YceK/YidQ family lipoprotein [Methylosarcina sp.]